MREGLSVDSQTDPSGDTVTAPVADVVAPVVVSDVVTDTVSSDPNYSPIRANSGIEQSDVVNSGIVENPLVSEAPISEPAQQETAPIVSDIVLEPFSSEPTQTPESVTIEPTPTPESVPTQIITLEPTPELPTIQVGATPPPSSDYSLIRANRRIDGEVNNGTAETQSAPSSSTPFSNSRELENKEPEVKIVERVVEKVVEKIVEKVSSSGEPAGGPRAQDSLRSLPGSNEWTAPVKEVIKEVPVEKIVEKIVYRDAPPSVCPPPTEEEREAIYHDFLIELSHEGTAKRNELMKEKLATILTLFDNKDHIMHKDVMNALDCSGTTATRFLTELRHENKILLHGDRGRGATYTKL